MQNKPKVKDAKMNISPFMTIKYVKLDTWLSWKNKAKTNPNKAKTNPISEIPKMNVNIYYTIDYSYKTYFLRKQNKPNSNPILSAVGGLQMNVNSLIIKDYRKNDFSQPKKQTQNKPNSKPVLSAVEWANFFKGQNRLPKNIAQFSHFALGINGFFC